MISSEEDSVMGMMFLQYFHCESLQSVFKSALFVARAELL